MKVVTKFSGSTVAPTKGNKFDWDAVADGKIHKATLADGDYSSAKGFLVSMSRWANETGHTVARYVSDDGSFVEFQLTPNPTPVAESV